MLAEENRKAGKATPYSCLNSHRTNLSLDMDGYDQIRIEGPQ